MSDNRPHFYIISDVQLEKIRRERDYWREQYARAAQYIAENK